MYYQIRVREVIRAISQSQKCIVYIHDVLSSTAYKYAPNLESLLIQQYVCVNVHRNKNGLWRPCLLTDWDEMSNLYRGPSIDSSYQVSVYLEKWLGSIYGRSSINSAHFVLNLKQTWLPQAILVFDWPI
jgi:hypothetical protein